MKEKVVNKPGVIVLGGHVQGLGIVRILGREGIPVIVIDNINTNLARHSKYSQAFFYAADKDLLGLLFHLADIQNYIGWVIFPTNDFHVKILSFNKQQLGKSFVVSTDSWDVIKLFYNKRNTYKLAMKLDIPIVPTFFPEDENELDSFDLNFPCIIKPAIMHDFYRQIKRKVLVCQNIEDLRMNYRRAIQIIPSDEVIVQEIIPGPSKNQFSACFLFLEGITYLHLTACRMRQHPLDFGNSTTYAETVKIPELKGIGEKILKAASYNGICEVEFKFDERDNQYKFLEVNTRTWKWHTIANKANTPFLKTYYDYLTGLNVQPREGFNIASFYHMLTDLPIQLQLLIKGFGYWRRKIKPVENAVWANDDLKPWFFEKLYLGNFIFNR